jgi:hypothetical protein
LRGHPLAGLAGLYLLSGGRGQSERHLGKLRLQPHLPGVLYINWVLVLLGPSGLLPSERITIHMNVLIAAVRIGVSMLAVLARCGEVDRPDPF